MERELSTQEYIILGLISVEPQSGYSIMSTLTGRHRWSASPGSIYPMLKRLEKEGLIAGRLEMPHETRPRKMYELTSVGEQYLDTWIKHRKNPDNMLEEREIDLMKFLFAEKRLSYDEILVWLNQYEEDLDRFGASRSVYHELGMDQASQHIKLVLESLMMELQMQKSWVQYARQQIMKSKS